MTVDVRAAQMKVARALLSSPAIAIVAEIRWCVDWVKIQKVVANWNLNRSSYGLKHVVQHWCKGYVANGSLIAAAIGLGREFREDGGPNVAFKFGERMIKATERAP